MASFFLFFCYKDRGGTIITDITMKERIFEICRTTTKKERRRIEYLKSAGLGLYKEPLLFDKTDKRQKIVFVDQVTQGKKRRFGAKAGFLGAENSNFINNSTTRRGVLNLRRYLVSVKYILYIKR